MIMNDRVPQRDKRSSIHALPNRRGATQWHRILDVPLANLTAWVIEQIGSKLGKAVLILACCLLPGSITQAQQPADRFIASFNKSTSLPKQAADLMRQTWANCQDCDGEEFLTQGLALLSDRYRAGLDAYDDDRLEDCIGMMAELRQDENPFLAVNAAAYEIKALIAQEKLSLASTRIEQLLSPADQGERRLSTYSYFAPEMLFLRGFTLLSDLKHQEADASFRIFLEQYPLASQRLVLAAQQMLVEIGNYQPGAIAEVVDLMKFAGRRLSHGDPGETVRTRQIRIIEILDKLIEEAEEEEQSGGGSSSGGGGKGSKGGNSPSSPMQDSMLPGGQGKDGELSDRRKANPAEAWGAMPPAQRQRVLQAIKDHFPSRYRQLVEQYYEELAKKP